MPKITREWLEEQLALCTKATPAPWRREKGAGDKWRVILALKEKFIADYPYAFRIVDGDNYDFIVAARTGYPTLLQWALEALERTKGLDWIAGEPMVCESHPWRLWPDGDVGCAGPGMPLSGAEGYQKQLESALERECRLREAKP